METGSVGARRAAQAIEQKLMTSAKALEATFLAEMLKTTGLGKPPESFGGGAGEDAFASFMVQQTADHMTDAGGIGLAQSIFEFLKEKHYGTQE